MKVHYDAAVDALYLTLADVQPEGTEELSSGINLDTTANGMITGIEILNASSRIDLDTILSFTLELDRDISQLPSAGHLSSRLDRPASRPPGSGRG